MARHITVQSDGERHVQFLKKEKVETMMGKLKIILPLIISLGYCAWAIYARNAIPESRTVLIINGACLGGCLGYLAAAIIGGLFTIYHKNLNRYEATGLLSGGRACFILGGSILGLLGILPGMIAGGYILGYTNIFIYYLSTIVSSLFFWAVSMVLLRLW